MRRHGPAAVFLGRFVSVLRYTVAWVAGLTSMRWTTFPFWNATGGISWAVVVGLASFYGGKAIGGAIGRYALGLAGLVVLLWLGRFALRRLNRSRQRSGSPHPTKRATPAHTVGDKARLGQTRKEHPRKGRP